MSYRPDDWDDIEAHITSVLYEKYQDTAIVGIAKAVEAGADAMLEAIRKLINYEDAKVYGSQCMLCKDIFDKEEK